MAGPNSTDGYIKHQLTLNRTTSDCKPKGAAMRHDEPIASFFSRWMRTRSASTSNDPAEYGTAFGLDLSMEGGLPHPVDPQPAAVAGKAGEGWLARWRRRA